MKPISVTNARLTGGGDRVVWGAGLFALGGAAAPVREQAWADRDRGGPLVVDIDSTLVEIHSENKAGAAPQFVTACEYPVGHRLTRSHIR